MRQYRKENPSYEAAIHRWQMNNPAKVAGYKLKSRLKVQYGLSVAEYEQMILSQDGKCAICQEVKPLVVDHDHAPGGCIRGMLCQKCNRSIAHLGDNLEGVMKAVEYLSVR